LFIQVPDFNLVVLDMIAVEDEILVATEAGVCFVGRQCE
jgi:hypothetical protein